ncbi:hypothetical protein B0J11DRAFT_533640 [Dendryphion nanum]|uniref:gamma-glutamylcyclotransferase n=1 Tax=Dendryphion nanum TaxID=256645 RepID=A0A9P9IIY2_9PLEO|nr:hypothetical protein B0J11DRAFT_533640 [Dendryphion nanum]
MHILSPTLSLRPLLLFLFPLASSTLSLQQPPSNQIIMATPSTTNKTKPTIYFGYGSNLWLEQMEKRCPTSKYLGVARLNGWKWIIDERGYANVVEVKKNDASPTNNNEDENEEREDEVKDSKEDYSATVFGLVFSLLPADESRLDANEGVPEAYTKEYLPCDFWQGFDKHGKLRRVDTKSEPEKKDEEMLVYVDRKRVGIARPREEYIYRMNRGIADAGERGVPTGYVKDILRTFIPEQSGERAEELGRRQALRFEDESGVFVRKD